MSLASEMQAAAAEAQGILAELGGAKPGKKNFTLSGVAYFGVLHETSAQMPGTATGAEDVRVLEIVATRDQFAARPDAARRPSVGAYGKRWTLTSVGESGIHYRFTCVPA